MRAICLKVTLLSSAEGQQQLNDTVGDDEINLKSRKLSLHSMLFLPDFFGCFVSQNCNFVIAIDLWCTFS